MDPSKSPSPSQRPGPFSRRAVPKRGKRGHLTQWPPGLGILPSTDFFTSCLNKASPPPVERAGAGDKLESLPQLSLSPS